MVQVSIRLGLAASILMLGGAGALQAADMPVKAVPMMPASYNWTGIYAGVHAGYGRGMKDWLNSSFDYPVKGFLGGGQIGVNQQIGNWVIGIEADASWSNLKGDQTLVLGGPLVSFTQTATVGTTIDALATVAGRVGFAQDRWLVYLKAGAAWARETHNLAFTTTTTFPGAAPITSTSIASGSETRLGYVVGFGTEFALWGNWSFKSEYNYIDMGAPRVRLTGTQTALGITAPLTSTVDLQQSLHLAKFGVNYRFGPDAPPAIAPARPAPGYNWTGAWVGVQAGYSFGRKHWPILDPDSRFNVSGWLAGGSSGASVQAGVLVIGAESEILWTGVRGSRQNVVNLGGGATQTISFASKVDWLSLNTVRVGFVAADRWLVYGKGGIALASEKHDLGISQVAPGLGSITFAGTGNALHTGYVVGLGVEHAFLGNWSAKLEYNYVGFYLQNVVTTGQQAFNIPPAQSAASPTSSRLASARTCI